MVVETERNWQSTACILCSRNCGLEVEVKGREMVRIRGDKASPISAGYLCQKAQRLNFYQNHSDRLTTPLRRREDGTFEAISWEVAIAEIAAKLVELRDTHGGESLAFYGGGGQGNHLGGPYAKALRSAMHTHNYYNSLSQEKTGGFWVDGRMFGRQNCHPTEDVEKAEVVVFIGTNPWMSHGIRNARHTLHELEKDPNRTMIVIDPRRTETAQMSDLHLQLKPGTDAFLMAAILAVIVREGEQDQNFLEKHTTGFEDVKQVLLQVPIEAFVQKAGVALEDVYRAAHLISGASSCSIRTDLGIEQTLYSTLNAYLSKLLFLLTGNFGKEGGNNLHTALIPIMGHSEEGAKQKYSPVTNFPFITNLLPPNILPAEIDTDHPKRVRGLVVDSANPIMTAADTQAYRAAFARLELLVVIDVAMTETAQLAHYVLPAASQFEKWEATFFNLDFPENAFHLRKPLFTPLEGTLPEPEIYTRLLRAMGEIPSTFPELLEAAKQGRHIFAPAFQKYLRDNPKLAQYAPVILYETLGQTLPDGAAAAAFLWASAHQFAQKHPAAVQRAGHQGEGLLLGEALFETIISSPSGVLMSVNEYEDSFSLIQHKDGLIHLEIPEMLTEISQLDPTESLLNSDYPFILVAGERRSYNANTVYRDPSWRKTDREGVLKIHPEDAILAGLTDGGWAQCETRKGAARVQVEVSEEVQRGLVTLPHGYGLEYPGKDGTRQRVGVALNELTNGAEMDPIAGTPYHKYVRVRLSPVGD